jgi:hypothetical protein
MRMDISGRIFIGGVLLLISTIAYSSQIFVFYSALGGWSWSTAKVLVPLNILVAMVYYNYYLACTTDPGRVPFDWVSIRWSLVYVRESALSGLTWLLSCSTRYRNLQLPYHNHPRKRSEWESQLHGSANLAMYLSPLDRIIAAVVVDVY